MTNLSTSVKTTNLSLLLKRARLFSFLIRQAYLLCKNDKPVPLFCKEGLGEISKEISKRNFWVNLISYNI